jgi:hypothetical protein
MKLHMPPYPTISAPSLVSTGGMPAVTNAGNNRIDQIDSPLDASAAEIPSKPNSVAVSKLSPNRRPNGYMC